jgi:hypothetical protein
MSNEEERDNREIDEYLKDITNGRAHVEDIMKAANIHADFIDNLIQKTLLELVNFVQSQHPPRPSDALNAFFLIFIQRFIERFNYANSEAAFHTKMDMHKLIKSLKDRGFKI